MGSRNGLADDELGFGAEIRWELGIQFSTLLLSRWGEAEAVDSYKILHPASPTPEQHKTPADDMNRTAQGLPLLGVTRVNGRDCICHPGLVR